MGGGEGVRKLRPTASRLRPDYLADFLPEQIWRTFYIVVLLDFLAYYFPRFRVQKDILSYLNITNYNFGLSALTIPKSEVKISLLSGCNSYTINAALEIQLSPRILL